MKRLCLTFVCLFGGTALFQSPVFSEEIPADLIARFEQLEKETEAMRTELAALKKEKSSQKTELYQPVEETKTPSQEIHDEVARQVQESAWKKGEAYIRPYGMFWASLIGADARFAPADSVKMILPGDAYGQSVCTVAARCSRLGIDVKAPDAPILGGMEMSGRLEIDFMGDLGAVENKPSVLMRHAYWKMENDTFLFLVGQTNDVISPLNSGSLNYFVNWFAGNIGYRNPQILFGRFFYPSERMRVDWKVSLSQLCGSDFNTSDHAGRYPTIQTRLGWTIASCDPEQTPIQFGISAHIGEQCYNLALLHGTEDVTIDTWSVNADLTLPLTTRFGIRGEVFHGQGLAGVNGGVDQSVDFSLLRVADASLRSIHATGGWAEIWWDLTRKAKLTVGYGIDNPLDSDMDVAPIRSNSVLYTNIVYQFTPFLRTGVEYSYWKTLYREGYVGGDVGKANVVQWMWQFEF
ncbi:MAG: hypothetical protein Q4D98_01330 [Planctomycetia bacterium]|nr:hypothetical protein [Planctomycetia bacterium]